MGFSRLPYQRADTLIALARTFKFLGPGVSGERAKKLSRPVSWRLSVRVASRNDIRRKCVAQKYHLLECCRATHSITDPFATLRMMTTQPDANGQIVASVGIIVKSSRDVPCRCRTRVRKVTHSCSGLSHS